MHFPASIMDFLQAALSRSTCTPVLQAVLQGSCLYPQFASQGLLHLHYLYIFTMRYIHTTTCNTTLNLFPAFCVFLQALHCLKLYLERLGFSFQPDGSCSSPQEAITDTIDLVSRAAMDAEFLNYRPTITAAAVLYCQRLQKGLLPFWPSSLATLTGYSNARTPELAAAINGAQRLIKQLVGSKRGEIADVADAAAVAAAAGEAAVGSACAAADVEVAVTDVEEVTAKLAAASVQETLPAAAAAAPAMP
jgi:hypothetical protein